MCEEDGMKQRNFNSLFSVFALKGAGRDKLVPFSYVYRIARRERPRRGPRESRETMFNPVLDALISRENPDAPFVDPVVEAAMTQESHKTLIMYIADVALGDKSCDVE